MLERINARDESSLVERDFEKCIPALGELADGGGWIRLSEDGKNVMFLSPLIYQCFTSLMDEEVVVERGALAALAKLVEEAKSRWNQNVEVDDMWISIMRGVLVPCLHAGLKNYQNDLVRRVRTLF